MAKLRHLLLLSWLPFLVTAASAQDEARFSVSVDFSQGLAVAIQPAFHARYGCLYPVTYRLQIPEGSTRLSVARRHSCVATWDTLPEKTSADSFNGIEAVRFDYPGSLAHVSAAFTGDTDSLFLRISDSTGAPATFAYMGVDPYYDDRRAVVTVSADDWNDSQDSRFCSTLSVFRSYGLYVTGGVITGPQSCSATTWSDIQKQADAGFLEVASHSRSHTSTPYVDPVGEVEGSADDIVSHVALPSMFRSNGRQYVYVWIAPYGEYDATVDSLVGARGYVVPRLYDDSDPQWDFSAWDAPRGHFWTILPTMEIGAPSWGGGSTDPALMNQTFDAVVAAGGIYHLMWHPQVLGFDLNQPYVTDHLRHISGHSDLWYANLGCVYLYHLIQQENRPEGTSSAPGFGPGPALKLQNSPNPLRSTTTIRFDVPGRAFVSVRVYNVLGHRVATLLAGMKDSGRYGVSWDARGAPSGIYFCRLEASMGAGNGRTLTSTRKMLVMK